MLDKEIPPKEIAVHAITSVEDCTKINIKITINKYDAMLRTAIKMYCSLAVRNQEAPSEVQGMDSPAIPNSIAWDRKLGIRAMLPA